MKKEIENIEVIEKPKSFIEKQMESIKEKTSIMTDTITNKLFDTNLLTALRTDLHTLNDSIEELRKQNNEIIKSEVFLFQILDEIRKECNAKLKTNIEIKSYIKQHFRIE